MKPSPDQPLPSDSSNELQPLASSSDRATSLPPPALLLVATSLADDVSDLSAKAQSALLQAPLVIGEEWKSLLQLMRAVGREPSADRKEFLLLNEHSSPTEVQEMADRIQGLARDGHTTALVSDCGTPGFCDPGADLVKEVRRRGLRVSSALGPCSLAGLISLTGARFQRFWFFGFPSRSAEDRAMDLKRACEHPDPVVLMDTPYRLQKLISELAALEPKRTAILTIDLSLPSELVLEGSLSQLSKTVSEFPADARKREFMLWLNAVKIPAEPTAPRKQVPRAKGTNPKAKRRDPHRG